MPPSNSDKKIILHVGMHKTGTTFLQWNVFPYIDAKFHWHLFYKNHMKNVLDLSKKPDYDKIKDQLGQVLSDEKINIISEENIYTYQFTKTDDRYARLERINKIFSKAKIIIGTRKKEENLASWYVEYVSVGGTQDYQGFLDNFLNIDKLDYKAYIDKLVELYGKENVFVYSIDELRSDQSAFVEKLCRFMDVEAPKEYRKTPARVGYSLEVLKLSLFLNRFFKTPVNPKGFIPWWGPILPQNIIFHSFLFRHNNKKKATLDEIKKLKIK